MSRYIHAEKFSKCFVTKSVHKRYLPGHLCIFSIFDKDISILIDGYKYIQFTWRTKLRLCIHTSDALLGVTCCTNVFYCAMFALGASLKFESCTHISCNTCNAKTPHRMPCSDSKCSTRPLLVLIKTSETGICIHLYLRKPHTRFIAPHKRHTRVVRLRF